MNLTASRRLPLAGLILLAAVMLFSAGCAQDGAADRPAATGGDQAVQVEPTRPEAPGRKYAWPPDYVKADPKAKPKGRNFVTPENASKETAVKGQIFRFIEPRYVASVAYSPTKPLALSGGADRIIKLWNLNTGKLERPVGPHGGTIRCLVFSADGRYALSASDDMTVKYWDITGDRLIRTLEGHRAWVVAVAFSPDGTKCLSASADETIRLWDLKTGRLIREFENVNGYYASLAFSPDGVLALSGGLDGAIKLWGHGQRPDGQEILWSRQHRLQPRLLARRPQVPVSGRRPRHQAVDRGRRRAAGHPARP